MWGWGGVEGVTIMSSSCHRCGCDSSKLSKIPMLINIFDGCECSKWSKIPIQVIISVITSKYTGADQHLCDRKSSKWSKIPMQIIDLAVVSVQNAEIYRCKSSFCVQNAGRYRYKS